MSGQLLRLALCQLRHAAPCRPMKRVSIQAAVSPRAFFVHVAPVLGSVKTADGGGAGFVSAQARSTIQTTDKGEYSCSSVKHIALVLG